MIVGLDEAGAGPAFGSLWAGAVHIPDDVSLQGLADSKKLTEKTRTRLRTEIVATCPYGLGEVTSDEIDRFGLGECRWLVFERALDDFFARNPSAPVSKLVVDGTLFRTYKNLEHECIPKADETVPHVSAASVLAKTTRDAQVVEWCDARPELDARYGFRKNKGYLAPVHVAGIRTYGLCDGHRKSYRIKALDA